MNPKFNNYNSNYRRGPTQSERYEKENYNPNRGAGAPKEVTSTMLPNEIRVSNKFHFTKYLKEVEESLKAKHFENFKIVGRGSAIDNTNLVVSKLRKNFEGRYKFEENSIEVLNKRGSVVLEKHIMLKLRN